MKCVYVLMGGCIGDYYIVKIFSSKEKAENESKNNKLYWVEEWEIQ
jgi:hypothetical protein